MTTLSTAQAQRLSELKKKIDDCNGPWTQALTKTERDEYQSLRTLEVPTEEPQLPASYFVEILDELYKLIRDGDARGHILRHKAAVLKFRRADLDKKIL